MSTEPDAAAARKQAMKDIFSGSMGGVAQTLTGQPFDAVKVRLQANPEAYPRGAMQVVREIMKEGPLSFYKGTMSPLIGLSACVAIQMGTVERMKRFFREGGDPTRDLTVPELAACGAAAGVANTPVVSPMELIRIRLQTQKTSVKLSSFGGTQREYRGTIGLFKDILKKEGIIGLYRGVWPTMCRESLGFAGFFSIYNMSVYKLARYVGGSTVEDLNQFQVFLCGAAAGYGYWIPVFPIDAIKSKMQVNSSYRSFFHCFRDTMKVSGWRGLYSGFLPCILRAMPANASIFVAFEMSMRILGRDENYGT